MRKILTMIVAVLALCALAVPTAQAGPPAPQAVTAPQQVTEPADAQDHYNGWKMGRLPNHSTICAANGIGGTYPLKYVVEKLNEPTNYALSLSVLNRCDGYSIENRFTIESYVDGSTVCAKFTNTGRVYDPGQGWYIWNQNPVLWLNHNDYCMPNDTAHAHRINMYVEYLLALQYHPTPSVCYATICSSTWSINNVKYPYAVDKRWLAVAYGYSI